MSDISFHQLRPTVYATRLPPVDRRGGTGGRRRRERLPAIPLYYGAAEVMRLPCPQDRRRSRSDSPLTTPHGAGLTAFS
jgi:hypothetical protein